MAKKSGNERYRLNRLVDRLASDEGYATGERKFPVRVSLDDAASIAAGLHGEVDRGVEARSQSIDAQGMVQACQRGCNGCCEEPIMVFRPEAARVARWLAQPEHAEVRAAFEAAYPAWRARTAETSARLCALYTTDAKAYVTAHIEGWAQGVMCPFNQGGDCSVYPVRPSVCRAAHAIGTSEHCTGAAMQPATRATFIPLDEFIERARGLLAAAHHATGGPARQVEPLADIVYAMLHPRATPTAP